jgi:hypothetical protein
MLPSRPEQIAAPESQYASWTARYALAAGQTVAVFDGLAQPCMSSHIDLDWAVERADAALHASQRIRNHPAGSQDLVPGIRKPS